MEEFLNHILAEVKDVKTEIIAEFETIHKKIDRLEAGQAEFETIHKKIDRLEAGQAEFETIHKKIDRLEAGQAEFKTIHKKIDRLEAGQQVQTKLINEVWKDIQKLENRLEVLEKI
jgi:flagellar biosynthesis regulator FlaF